MSGKKYSERVNGGSGALVNDVPLWPNTCSVTGCNGETTIAYITVKNPASHKTRTAIFSEVGTARTVGDGQKLQLRGSYEFVRWVTRCASCFMAESIKTKRQQMHVDSDEAFVRSHREKLMSEK